MSLVPLIEVDAADEAQKAFLAQVPPLNLFKAQANAPLIATQTAQFGGVILFQTDIDPKVREIAILRAANLLGNRYEIGHHERIGRDLGMSEAQIAGVRTGGDRSGLSEAEVIAATWAEEVVGSNRASAELVARALEVFGPKQTVELSMTVGYYLMVAYFLETFEIPFEGASFEDGVKVS